MENVGFLGKHDGMGWDAIGPQPPKAAEASDRTCLIKAIGYA